MNTEKTLVLIKPDGVERGLIGEVIRRIEQKGLRIVGLKMLQLSCSKAEQHYAVHKGQPYYEKLMNFITSAPLVAIAVEGPEAIALSRKLMGATNPLEAPPGSIRGDFAFDTRCNIVHGSDSIESAEKEIPIFFQAEELMLSSSY